MSKSHWLVIDVLAAGLFVGLSGCRWSQRESASVESAAGLRSVLSHTNPVNRLSAVESLSACGLDGVSALSRATADSDPRVSEAARKAIAALGVEVSYGAVVRGPQDCKRLALVFTGHEFAESGEQILDALGRHKSKASFFLTGDFLRNPAFAGLVRRIAKEGHQMGPHSDKHLLYCSWGLDRKTLVSRKQFEKDLEENCNALRTQAPGLVPRFLLPPYEHYNQQIADWTQASRMVLVNFTPGTRSNADYTGEADTNFVSSSDILEGIVSKEQRDPNGLNGFILLLHVGAGPSRADKFHSRFGELLDLLAAKGYEFVTVGELLGSP